MRDGHDETARRRCPTCALRRPRRVAAKIAGLLTSSYKYVLIDKMVYINVAIEPARHGRVRRDACAALALRPSGPHEYDAQTQFDRVDRLNAPDGPG